MKGVGSIISSVLIIIVLLFFVYIFIAMTGTSSQKKLELNLNTADFLKVKNTISIVNRSLSSTWFVSTVQLLFKAGDESVGCGYDDFFTENVDVIKKGYWYQYNDTNLPKDQNPVTFSPDSSGFPKKYNILMQTGDFLKVQQPRICYPTDQYFINFLKDNFAQYSEIPKRLDINGVKLAISGVNFDITNLQDDRIVSDVKEKIDANALRANPTISAQMENVNTIFTSFKKILETGRNIVNNATDDSNQVAARSQASQNILYSPADTEASYKNKVDAYLKTTFASAIPPDAAAKLAINSVNSIDVRAGNNGEAQYRLNPLQYPVASGFGIDKQGLLLHYDSAITISELGDVGGSTGTKCGLNVYGQVIDNVVSDWKFSDTDLRMGLKFWITTDFNYSKDEVKALVAAIMEAESSVDGVSCNPRAVSICGAAGLMQLMPGTAKELGLTNIFGDASFVTCLDGNGNVKPENIKYHTDLQNAIQNLDNEAIKSVDDRFDPQKSVKSGADYIQSLFATLSEYTRDKEELLRLVIAAYNTGPNNVISAINKAKDTYGIDTNNVKYSSISGFLPSQTQDYVSKVLGYYTGNGGTITSSSYYYNNEKDNTFTPRPFSLSMKAEDYLNVLDCINDVPNDTANPKFKVPFAIYGWNTQGDMVCCGAALWTCNPIATQTNHATDVSNIGNHGLTFDPLVNDSGTLIKGQDSSAGTCANNIDNKYRDATKDDNDFEYHYALRCQAGGFSVQQYTVPKKK